VGCESCHGPLATHAQEPASLKPVRPNGRDLCLVCHAENGAKPETFPQVDPKDHGDAGPCTACHKPHHPEIA
jgi:predicted CXXCH cytochrome family protein